MKTILSVEESATLIKLGIPEDIATFFYCNSVDNPNEEYPTLFNLVDLLSILPKKVSDRRKIFELRIGVCDCIGADEQWYVEYKDSRTDIDELESFQSAEELIDAIYLMLCWLKNEDNKNLVWL